MKATDLFKKIVNDHLQEIAAADRLFAETLAKPNKSIDGCVNYIFSGVKESGFNGFADEEIFAMAVHYFDEDLIKDVEPINAKVVVNHSLGEVAPKAKAPAAEKKKPVKKQLPANQAAISF